MYLLIKNRRISRCHYMRYKTDHICYKERDAFPVSPVSMCVRIRLCQIATSAISGNTSVPGGLSVTPAVSRGRGETRLTSSLTAVRAVCGNTLYKSYMTLCMLLHCIINKHADIHMHTKNVY